MQRIEGKAAWKEEADTQRRERKRASYKRAKRKGRREKHATCTSLRGRESMRREALEMKNKNEEDEKERVKWQKERD